MHKYHKNLILFLFICFLCLQFRHASFAAYEVVNALTVDSDIEKEEKESREFPISTYNDPELPDFSEDSSLSSLLERKLGEYITKRKLKKNKIQPEETFGDEKAIQDEEEKEKPKRQLSARVGENEVIDNKNKFAINADSVSYDDSVGDIIAKGHVEIISKEQGITLKSDEAILNKKEQNLKLFGNVKIIQGGVEMLGEYMLVDLNEQNILVDNPVLDAYSFKINAQEGFLIENEMQMINGTLKSNKNGEIILESRGFQVLDNVKMDYVVHRNKNFFRSSDNDTRNQNYLINAKEIVYTCYKDHNTLTLKKADIYYNKRKIIAKTDLDIIQGKDTNIIETNSMEAGNLRNFGMYAGYGFVSKLPRGQVLKLMPALVYGDSNLGVGIIGRYRTQNSSLEAGYATSSTNLVARGKYKFSNGFELRYGRNAYLPEGFMGARRSGYAAQLEYKKSFYIPDLDVNFNNAVYAGIFSDYQKHNQEEAYATTRFRYMAEIRKTLLSYENKEQDLKVSLTSLAQAAATLYGDGHTAAVARIGPFITTKLKWWESSIGYLLGGVYGDSPFVFDKYRYGRSSIMLNEKIRFNDKFALGFRATVSPLKDNYEKDLLTESRLYAIFGPEDLKLALSYDFVRDIAHLNFMFLIGTKASKINFDRFTTKDIDRRKDKQDFYKSIKVNEGDIETL